MGELNEGGHFEYAGIALEILDTPGHSRGHIVFVYRGETNAIFGGDVLFHGGIGRTDFADGDIGELTDSIQNKLFEFDDETVVFPGYRPPTKIGMEIEHNPFKGYSSRLRSIVRSTSFVRDSGIPAFAPSSPSAVVYTRDLALLR